MYLHLFLCCFKDIISKSTVDLVLSSKAIKEHKGRNFYLIQEQENYQNKTISDESFKTLLLKVSSVDKTYIGDVLSKNETRL